MSNYVVTVIRTGNSFALRVPKRYMDDAHLTLGQKTTIPLPTPEVKQDRAKIQEILRQLQDTKAFKSIPDPASWQRQERKDRPLPGRDA